MYVTCVLSGLLKSICCIAPVPLQSVVADFDPAAVLPRTGPEAVIASWSPTRHKSSQTGSSRLSGGGTPHTGNKQREPVSPPLSPRSAIAGQPQGLHGLYWVLLGLASPQEFPSITSWSASGFWSTPAHVSDSGCTQAISILTSSAEPALSVSAMCASALTCLKAHRHCFPHSALCADARKQHPWLAQADEYERQQSPETKRELEHWVDGIAAEVAAEEEHALRWVAALKQLAVLAYLGSCCSSATLVACSSA